MYQVVLVTTKNKAEAENIAKALVEEKMIACANIVNNVLSVFRWEGKFQTEDEALMILKTREEKVPEVIEKVKSLHSYDVPEVIALSINQGNQDYLNWIKDET